MENTEFDSDEDLKNKNGELIGSISSNNPNDSQIDCTVISEVKNDFQKLGQN